MRIVFINLHCNSFIVKDFVHYVTGQSFSPKNKFLLDYLLENDYEVCSYISKEGNIFNSFFGTKITWPFSMFRIIEHRKIMKINGISMERVKILKKLEDIKDDDIVIIYSVYRNQLIASAELKGHKIVNLIHFFGDRATSELLKGINPAFFLSEANYSRFSDIFKENYRWFEGEFIVHPFSFQERFSIKKEFSERKSKAVAIGTVTFPGVKDFVDFYGDDCYQPLRRQILEAKNELSDIIDCHIYRYFEDDNYKQIKSDDSKVIKLYKILYNQFHTGKQKKYFSFDMVKKFNEYKMCIVPEDIQGAPGIGFVEGMACGCAYIGLNSDAYSDYGMVEGIHYIGYDGTLVDLRKKIEYYMNHEDELERIAKAGYEFAREHFNSTKVAKAIIQSLENSIISV